MSKHTMEPWRVMGMGGWFLVTTAGPIARQIADCGNGFDGSKIDKDLNRECRDNAHLFADARETAAERDALKELNAELLADLKQAYEYMPPPTPGSLGEDRMLKTIGEVKDTIDKAEGMRCTTPK